MEAAAEVRLKSWGSKASTYATHSMATANLNKSEEFVTNTTAASKYIPRTPRISINWNPPFQAKIYLVKVPLNVNIVRQHLLHRKCFKTYLVTNIKPLHTYNFLCVNSWNKSILKTRMNRTSNCLFAKQSKVIHIKYYKHFREPTHPSHLGR